MEVSEFIIPGALMATGGAIGYLLATRLAQREKNRTLRQINSQSLELLETRSELRKIQHLASQHDRRERLLKLTMDELQKSKQHVEALKLQQQARDRSAYIELSRMRMRVVRAKENSARLRRVVLKAARYIEQKSLTSDSTSTLNGTLNGWEPALSASRLRHEPPAPAVEAGRPTQTYRDTPDNQADSKVTRLRQNKDVTVAG